MRKFATKIASRQNSVNQYLFLLANSFDRNCALGVLFGVLCILVGILCVLFGVFVVLVGVLGVLVGVLGVFLAYLVFCLAYTIYFWLTLYSFYLA